MDLIDDLLAGNDAVLDTKKLSKMSRLLTPVLYSSDSHPEMTFLVDEYLGSREVGFLKRFVENQGVSSYQILYSCKVKFTEKDLSTGVWKKYRDFKWNFPDYIPKWSKIISFGKSIFSICEDNSLDASIKSGEETGEKKLDSEKNSIVAGYYDTLLEYSSFNDPKTWCVVFPVDCWKDLINRDNGLFKDAFEFWFLREQIQRAKKFEVKPVKLRKVGIHEVTDSTQFFREKLNHPWENRILSFDLETRRLDPWSSEGKIICITFSFYDDPYNTYFLDFENVDMQELEDFILQFDLLGTNSSYDFKWLVVKAGLSIKIVNKMRYDTIHLSQISNTLERNSLKSNIWNATWLGGYELPLDRLKEAHPEYEDDYSLIYRNHREEFIKYSCYDPMCSVLVHKEYEKRVKELDAKYPVKYIPDSQWSMWRFYTEMRIPTQKVFTKAEIRGAEVNWTKVNQVGEFLCEKIKVLEKEIHELLGTNPKTFNVNSTDQLGIRFQELGFTPYGLGKKGLYNVNEYSLDKWIEEGKEVAKKVKEMHELGTMFKTFSGLENPGEMNNLLSNVSEDDEILSEFSEDWEDALEDSGNSVRERKKEVKGYFQYRKFDNRVHPTFGVGLNTTGRNSCKNPNLQNGKKHGYLALDMRDFFTPQDEENFCISEKDGASLQLRIIASLSQDQTMKELFAKGIDMHTLTASMLFGQGKSFEEFESRVKAKDKKYSEWRFGAKAPNFSLAFNSTARAFASRSLWSGPYKWTLEMCKEYVKLHHLEALVKEKYQEELSNKFSKMDNPDKFAYFHACGEHIKETWMNKYSGVKRFIATKIQEGHKFGACFTPFGFIRRVPHLIYSTGNDENKGRTKNNENIMTNVEAQLFEWVLISRALISEDKYIEDNDLKSFIIGNVHDSIVDCVSYDEAYEVTMVAKRAFEEDIPENRGVHHELTPDFGIWGFGMEPKNLEDMKDVEKFRESVRSHVRKQRQETIFKDNII